jgi:hypothetical protein
MQSKPQLWWTEASVLRQVSEQRSLKAEPKRKTSSSGGFYLPPSLVNAGFENHDALLPESIADSCSYLDFTAPVTHSRLPNIEGDFTLRIMVWFGLAYDALRSMPINRLKLVTPAFGGCGWVPQMGRLVLQAF